MTIRYQHEEIVRTTPELAFAAIDDLPLTSEWLPPCVSLTKHGVGPNTVGDRLEYVFKQGGKEAKMEGEIVARVPDEQLHCKYVDRMFDVSVDLRVAKSSGGTVTTHIIEITPKTFMARLMSPVIRLGIGKQTREAAKNLKRLLESDTSS